MHDFGDVFAGLLIGSLILGLWYLASIYKVYDFLNKELWIAAILIFHLIYYLTYPSHLNHEPSSWFLGVMLGWFAFASNVTIEKSQVVKLLTVSLSTCLVFITMIMINNLNTSIAYDGLLGELFSYALGIGFSLIVTWIIPRAWQRLNLT